VNHVSGRFSMFLATPPLLFFDLQRKEAKEAKERRLFVLLRNPFIFGNPFLLG